MTPPRSLPTPLQLYPLAGIGELSPADNLAVVLLAALRSGGHVLDDGDVLVVAQKAVSKAEGRYVDLATVEPSPEALAQAAATGKDPRLVELVLRESTAVLRARKNVLVVRHRLGLVMAQAGIDRSNVPQDAGGSAAERVLLLPEDPDASARRLRAALRAATGADVAVIICDSFGRPWRLGTTNVAIGCDGTAALWDRRGEPDREGRRLEVTMVACADALAGAAGLVMGEGAEGVPAVLVRGYRCPAPPSPASALIRPLEEDMFR